MTISMQDGGLLIGVVLAGIGFLIPLWFIAFRVGELVQMAREWRDEIEADDKGEEVEP